MSYLTLGYNNLLSRQNNDNQDAVITEANVDSIISSGVINWDKINPTGETPEAGADKTSENIAAGIEGEGALARLDYVDTAEIVDGAVEKVKMALLSVDADIIAAGAITENKLFTGAVTADKIAANTITAAKIAANTITASQIAADTITANEINVSQLSAISANIGDITAGTITGLTITGGTIQTNTTGKRVVLSSTGNDVELYSTTAFCGSIAGLDFGGVGQGVNIAGEDIIGFSVGTSDTAYFNSTGFTVVDGKALNAQWGLVDNIVLGNNSPLTDNGSMYFDGTHFYGRISGSWVQIDGGGTGGDLWSDSVDSNIVPDGAYTRVLGSATYPFSSLYATTIYFARSGETTKYMQMGTSGGIETTGDFYSSGTINSAKLKLPVGTNVY